MGKDERQQRIDRFNVPAVGELLDGRYRVEAVIASGGMGVILRAQQVSMERSVAIKLLHPHIAASDPIVVERFTREVRLAKQLNHPNTIRLYDFGESEDGLVYVAMELLEGMDLKRVIANDGPLPAGRVLDITRQMLDGLAEAHANGFIHRDLKPGNVFITHDRRGEDLVKVLDFGIAKSLGDAADLTGSGAICGTPSYVAPEYLMQQCPGKPADVYAVGLIVLEMFTGRQVFRGEMPVQTMMMHLKLDPDIPPEIERTPLAAVIRKACAKDPQERYQDAEQMLEAIGRVSSRVPSDLVVCTPNYRVLPWPSDSVNIELGPDAGRRALSDTIIPKPGDEQDSGLDLPQARSTPSWIEQAAASDIFRHELRRELEAQAFAEPERAQTAYALAATRHDASRRGVVISVVALLALVSLGGVVMVVADPGRPPQIEMLGETASPINAAAADPAATAPQPVLPAPSVDEAASSAPVDTPPVAALKQGLLFSLDTDPSGAAVMLDGARVGQTPYDWRVAPDDLPRTLRFVLAGYDTGEIELMAESPPIVVEKLHKHRHTQHRDPTAPAPAKTSRTPTAPSASRKHVLDKRIEQVMDQYLGD